INIDVHRFLRACSYLNIAYLKIFNRQIYNFLTLFHVAFHLSPRWKDDNYDEIAYSHMAYLLIKLFNGIEDLG
ncbi:hypothetical protein L9F63_016103, partial [Diploptera punctata]